MSSISDAAKRTAATAGNGFAADPIHFRSIAGRWLMFSDYGLVAQRHMATVWSCTFACALADAVWLPNSRLHFSASNWTSFLQGILGCAFAGVFIAAASRRLRRDESLPAIALRRTLVLTEFLWRAALPLGALLAAGTTLSYLITSANLAF